MQITIQELMARSGVGLEALEHAVAAIAHDNEANAGEASEEDVYPDDPGDEPIDIADRRAGDCPLRKGGGGSGAPSFHQFQ